MAEQAGDIQFRKIENKKSSEAVILLQLIDRVGGLVIRYERFRTAIIAKYVCVEA